MTPKSSLHNTLASQLSNCSPYKIYGTVRAIRGLLIEISGIEKSLVVGDRGVIIGKQNQQCMCEVVGFLPDAALAMPFSSLDGIGLGSLVEKTLYSNYVSPSTQWLGRIINPLAQPIDSLGPLPQGDKLYHIRSAPPLPSQRNRIGEKLDVGVRSINTFTTVCQGQRLGIFSGSGVGKSSLIAQMAKFTSAPIIVIGLVGERGREVREFIEDALGTEGLKRSVVVVASSDEAALLRRESAYMTMTVSEYFRDQGYNVLCLLDSITRFAMAQREIGLSAGEPPTSKGYTPTVFSELPKVLERAGPGKLNSKGSITGLFSVLVEGDDFNEPISDAVRGILDGHIILSRSIAERNRFPAIDVLSSVSRTMPQCNSDDENILVNKARSFLSSYANMEELIKLGAYRLGSDSQVDQAIFYFRFLDDFLSQSLNQSSNFQDAFQQLHNILSQTPPQHNPNTN